MTLSEMITKAQRGMRIPLSPTPNSACGCLECSKRRVFVLLLERAAARAH